jgi:hypothetical protein
MSCDYMTLYGRTSEATRVSDLELSSLRFATFKIRAGCGAATSMYSRGLIDSERIENDRGPHRCDCDSDASLMN